MSLTSAHFRQPDNPDLVTPEPTLPQMLVALSSALDLAEGAAPGHAVRTCLLATRIGQSAGLAPSSLTDLFYASLLKDAGSSSSSARLSQLIAGDDCALKAGLARRAFSNPFARSFTSLRLLWQHVHPQASPFDRLARAARAAASFRGVRAELIQLRSERGAAVISRLGLGIPVASAIRHLDEQWSGDGYPAGLCRADVPLLSRLIAIAQHLDSVASVHGPWTAIDSLQQAAGRVFDPELARAAVTLNHAGRLWANCLPHDDLEHTRAAVLKLDAGNSNPLSPHAIDAICEVFAGIVDAKSSFTSRHSVAVADAAIAIGEVLGFSSRRIELLRRAALLHDLGKLAIPNTILDTPSRLTAAELERVHTHPRLSAQILAPIPDFAEIGLLAGEHHEKLDGSGYPNRLRAEQISLESRLIAVADIYSALSEPRPYRAALRPEQISVILDREAAARIDPICYEALRTVISDLTPLDTFEPASDGAWSLPAFDATEAYI